jgi:peroxiredoxin
MILLHPAIDKITCLILGMIAMVTIGVQTTFGQAPWLSGQIDGAHDNLIYKVMLYEMAPHRTMRTVDSAAVAADGSFVFMAAPNAHPCGYRLAIKYGKPFHFLAEPHVAHRLSTTAFDISMGMAKLEGSTLNEMFLQLTVMAHELEQEKERTTAQYAEVPPFDPLYNTRSEALREAYFQKVIGTNRQIRELSENYAQMPSAKALAGLFISPMRGDLPGSEKQYDSNRSFQHHHFFDEVDLDHPLSIRLGNLYDRIDEYLTAYIDKNSAKGMVNGVDKLLARVRTSENREAIATYVVKHFNRLEEDTVVQHVKDRYYSEGCEINSTYLTDAVKVQVGAEAPDISLQDENGNVSTLHGASAPKATIIMFWATWCPHCTDNMPAMERFYQEHRPKGLDVYAVAIGSPKHEWKRAIAKKIIRWRDVLDESGPASEVVAHYNIKGTPAYFLMDGKRKVLLRTSDPQEMMNAALKLLQ